MLATSWASSSRTNMASWLPESKQSEQCGLLSQCRPRFSALKRKVTGAAIEGNDIAGDVTRARRSEEHREISELVRLTHALHRHFFLCPLAARFCGWPALVDLLTAQLAGLYAVDCHAVRRHDFRQSFRPHVHCCFRSVRGIQIARLTRSR